MYIPRRYDEKDKDQIHAFIRANSFAILISIHEGRPIGTHIPLQLETDSAFEAVPIQIGIGKVREGRVVLAQDELPLIVTTKRGQGRVTALLFSPEREPFRSWKNQPAFWARLIDVPPILYTVKEVNPPSGWSTVPAAWSDRKQAVIVDAAWFTAAILTVSIA